MRALRHYGSLRNPARPLPWLIELPPDRAQLEELLRLHRGVVSDVARAMSRSRKQVYRWLTHHSLALEAFRHEPP